MKRLPAALLIFLTAAASAVACSCLPQTALQKLEASKAVFVGRVVGLREEGRTRHYEFEVAEAFKGSPPATVTVTSSGEGSMCGSYFDRDQSYLIYANGVNQLVTSLCSGNHLAASPEAKTELAAIRGRKKS